MRIVGTVAVLLAITSGARAQQASSPSPVVMPEVIVQRFIDAGNARNADAMAALVAPMPSSRAFLAVRSSSRRVTASGRTIRGNCSLCPPTFHHRPAAS